MIIKRIPMNALLKAVFAILTEKQSTPVYDEVPETAVAPYITLGAFTSKSIGNKLADLSDISLAIHIWSEYNGKAEVNEIADDITAVLTTWKLSLAGDFVTTSQDVDFFEAFAEDENGYRGVITFTARIQNIKQGA